MHLDSSWHIISLIALYKLLDRVLCNKKRLKLNAMLLPSINLFCFQHDVMEKQIELHFSFVYLYHALALKCGWGIGWTLFQTMFGGRNSMSRSTFGSHNDKKKRWNYFLLAIKWLQIRCTYIAILIYHNLVTFVI